MTAEPFNVVLARLLEERGLTPHGLFTRVREQTGWGSSTGFSKMVAGELVPAPEGIRLVAAALDVEPELFAEYRLGVAREALDWREVGLEQALANLGELDVDTPEGTELAGRVRRAERSIEKALEQLRG